MREELAAFNFSARNDEALQGLISLSTLSHRLRPVLPFTPNHTPSTPIPLRLWVLHGGFNLKVLVPSSVSRFVNGTQVWNGLTARAMMEKSCFQRLSMWRRLILELKQTDHPQFIQWAYETLNSQKWLVLTWLVAILIGTFCAIKCSMDVKGSSWNHKEHLFLRMHNSLFLISVYTHCICDLYTLNQRNCCEIDFIRFNLIFHKLSLLGRIFIVKKVHVVP